MTINPILFKHGFWAYLRKHSNSIVSDDTLFILENMFLLCHVIERYF